MLQHFSLKQILVIVIGIALIVFGIFSHINTANLIDIGLETTAVVVERRRTGGGGTTTTHVFVEYTVDGVLYRNHLAIQFARTYEGEEVIILYNPNNPNQITLRDRDRATDNLDEFSFLLGRFPLGALLIFFGVRNGLRNIKKSKQKNIELRQDEVTNHSTTSS